MQSLKTPTKILLYLLLVGVGITMILPFAWMVSTSLKEAGEVFAPTVHWIPSQIQWHNYVDAVLAVPFGRMFLNSLLVSLTVTAGVVATSSLAAYAFARLRFPGRDALFLGYLGTMMIPGVVTMIPVFCLLKILGDRIPYEFFVSGHWFGNVIGGDSYFALIAPGLFSAYGTFLLRQFFMTLPKELDEAAMLDGCSKWGVFRHVIIPLSGPALATLTIFQFMGSWRDFMWPLIINNMPDMQTLPVGLATFQSTVGIQYNLMMAAAVLVMLPLIVVFAVNQRFFTEGIKLQGIKG